MKYGYEIYPVNCEETQYWIAESKASIKKGIENEKQRTVYGQGKTMEEAIKDLEANETKWIEMAEYCNLKIAELPKKAVSPHKLKWRERVIIFVVFLICLAFAASSVLIDYKMLIGFFASVLFTTTPLEVIRTLNKKYTSTGYMSSLDKYHQYLEVFEKSQSQKIK
ncbi:MAG: hypothetical protein AAGU75_03200 [Bacillota bacterium]